MELNKKIIKINNDKNLTSIEKTKKIQELFNLKAKQNNNNNYDNNNNNNNSKSQEDIIGNPDNIEEIEINCSHYERNCLIIAKCCNKIYPCRICHDENENHKMNRHETEKIKCKKCKTIQDISNKCINCEIQFGEYYCEICRLWKTSETPTFHCDKCKICRIGKRDLYYHCDKCNCCISKSNENHNCINNIFKTDCSICMENLFNSRENISQLRCGHAIHQKCLNEYIGKNNFRCPLCKKSITDLTEQWNIQRYMNEIQPIPDDYKDWIQKIYCFDCQNHSYTKFSLISFECYKCCSFNIQQIDVIKPENEIYNEVKIKLEEDFEKRNEFLNSQPGNSMNEIIPQEIREEIAQRINSISQLQNNTNNTNEINQNSPPQSELDSDTSDDNNLNLNFVSEDVNLDMEYNLSELSSISEDSDLSNLFDSDSDI